MNDQDKTKEEILKELQDLEQKYNFLKSSYEKDITEWKQNEDKIHEKDIQFRKLSSNVPDLIFQFTRRQDGKYCVPIASEGIRNIFGCTPEDVVDDFAPIAKVIYPEDSDRVISDIEYSAKHLTFFTCEFRVQIPGKSIQWIYSRSTPEKMADGSITWYGFNADITERKQAEEVLRESEDRYKIITQNTLDIVFMLDKTGKQLFFNESVESILGYKQEELIGKSFTRYVPISEMPKYLHQLKNVFLKKEIHNFITKIYHKNGNLVDVEINGKLIKHDGKLVALGTIRDITERKRAEERLQYHQKLLQEMGRVAKIGGWEFDVATGKGTWTEETAIIHDLDPKDETSMEHGLSFYTDESRSKVVDAIKEAIEFGKSYNLELELITVKNVHKWVQTIGHPQIVNGKVINLRGSFQDITERKLVEKALRKNEEKYRNIFENAQEGIFQTNINGTYISVNPAFAKMFGFDSPEELINDSLDISKDSYFDPMERDKYLKMIEKDGFVEGYEYEVKHKDGTKLWFYEDSRAVKDENGRIQYFEGFVLDITERKRAEEALHDSENRYRSVIENASEGIIIYDMATRRVLNSNPAYQKLLGYTAAEMCELTIYDIVIPNYHGVDFMIDRIKTEKDVWIGERQHRRKDGSKVDVEASSSLNIYRGKEVFSVIVRDITERKKAEEALRKNEEKYRNIFENAQEGIFQTNINGTYISVNPALAKMLGFDSPEELINTIHDISKDSYYDPIERDKYLKMIEKDGFVEGYEYEVKHKDGTKLWFYEDSRAVKDENGIIQYFEGFVIDITERKRAEEELKKLNKAVENSSEVIFMTDKKGLFNFVNPAFTEVYGYKADEVVSKTTPRILKSGMNKTSDYEAFWQTLLNKQVIKGDLINKTKDGKLLNIEGSTSPVFDESGDITGFLAIQRDITERKLAEGKQQLQITALNAAANAIVITNNEGTIEWVNSAFTTLTGYDFAEAIDKNPREIVKSGMHDNSFYKDLWDTLLAGKIWRGETINRRKNGTLYNEMQTITPLIETDGKINHFISIKEDITERKHAEQELIIAKERAEESDNLKTAFLQNMSHEIRTPLNGIIGFSRMLNSDNLSKEDVQEFTNIISVSGERLIEIVNNVLEMSKIQTGQVEIVSKPIVINYLFSDLFDFFSNSAKEKNINLNYHSSGDINKTIYSDEGKLHQILTNLINNAIKFTHSGRIDYGYEIIDNYIQFYVKDTGVGIPEELHEKIFDRFIQAEQSISRSYEGAGLGLAICKGLVEMLGGSIRVESEINKGTTFYFTLPYNEEFAQTQEDEENPENSVKYVKGKILIAEDDWVSSRYLIRFFEDANITVIHAVNGEQAVELVINTPDIDMIMMDIQMPVMDGFEAAKLIKNMRPDLTIIAQTAYAFVEEKHKILSAGFDDYISKPYDTKKLMTLIDKNLKIN